MTPNDWLVKHGHRHSIARHIKRDDVSIERQRDTRARGAAKISCPDSKKCVAIRVAQGWRRTLAFARRRPAARPAVAETTKEAADMAADIGLVWHTGVRRINAGGWRASTKRIFTSLRSFLTV